MKFTCSFFKQNISTKLQNYYYSYQFHKVKIVYELLRSYPLKFKKNIKKQRKEYIRNYEVKAQTSCAKQN